MTSILKATASQEDSGISAFVQSAKLEFQASLQLLAERAAFVTGASGAAIAIEERGRFVYCASAGDSSAEPGTNADISDPALRKCIDQNEPYPVRSVPDGKQTSFALIAPIVGVGSEKVMGLLQLAGNHEFQDQDVEAVRRIADLVSVAVENHKAAEQATERIREGEPAEKTEIQPASWHLSDSTKVELPKPQNSAVSASSTATTAHACQSCGFPVSPGRVLCVDCEQKRDAPIPAGELFALQNQESWVSAHGYTILSVLIPTVATVIYFWMRR